MKPSPFWIGTGQYKCEYAAFQTGQYEIRILVGRGGSEYMDEIEGVDPEPSNEEHDFVFSPSSRHPDDVTSSTLFTINVAPGDTSPRVTSAKGEGITVNTAGAIATFLITALDAFGNRRPGGDVMTSIMRSWNPILNQEANAENLPETGSVLDNKDGSYAVSYRITKAGLYQHSISVIGSIGAGTPVFLDVSSDAAYPPRTYVYGSLLSLETGKASTIYVQTRDQFGNHIRVLSDPDKPCTGCVFARFCALPQLCAVSWPL